MYVRMNHFAYLFTRKGYFYALASSLLCFLGLTESFLKAAPRIELGIKDLQSSALPLGHATISQSKVWNFCQGFLKDLPGFVKAALYDQNQTMALRAVRSSNRRFSQVQVCRRPTGCTVRFWLHHVKSSNWLRRDLNL